MVRYTETHGLRDDLIRYHWVYWEEPWEFNHKLDTNPFHAHRLLKEHGVPTHLDLMTDVQEWRERLHEEEFYDCVKEMLRHRESLPDTLFDGFMKDLLRGYDIVPNFRWWQEKVGGGTHTLLAYYLKDRMIGRESFLIEAMSKDDLKALHKYLRIYDVRSSFYSTAGTYRVEVYGNKNLNNLANAFGLELPDSIKN